MELKKMDAKTLEKEITTSLKRNIGWRCPLYRKKVLREYGVDKIDIKSILEITLRNVGLDRYILGYSQFDDDFSADMTAEELIQKFVDKYKDSEVC